MDGYSVTEAASVLGVPTERVWELLARGVLSGTADGETGMRVFLQPRPAPPAVNEAPPSNGHGRSRESEAEASPFRELLTEFRNLTERYGQALLALGEARGEVASLRSRVDVLEARMDLRLPMGGETGWAAPPAPQPRAPEVGPIEKPATGHQPSPPAPTPETETAVDIDHEVERAARRKRGRPHFSDDFAEALARAEDPNPAVLPGAEQAGAAHAALQDDRSAGGEEPAWPDLDLSEAALPRELPAAEPIAVAESLPQAEAVIEPAPEPDAEAIAEAEPLPEVEVAPEPVPEPELELDVEPMPEPEMEIEPAVGGGPIMEATLDEADLQAQAAPEEDMAHVEGPAERTPAAARDVQSAADATTPAPLPEPEAIAEPDGEPEPIVLAATPGVEPGEDQMAAAESQPEPEAMATPEPEPGAAAATASAEPQPEPRWDQERYTTEIEEPDWWTPDESVWTEPVAEPVAEPAPESGPEPAETAVEGSAPDEPAADEPPLPEPYRGEETMLWLGGRPQPSEPAGWPAEDAAGEMEVASTGRRESEPTASASGLPGADELDEALASLDAVAPHRGTLDEDDNEEPRASQAQAPESAPRPPRPRQAPVVSAELRSPASRAYRRLRRIFPG